jgi:calcineurin-like phosphoesterase family protein
MIKFGKKLAEDKNYFITSDLHFCHKNILKFSPDTRPFKEVDHMTESLIQEWNSKVKPEDVVFHLGDFSFLGGEATKKIIERLNGTIVFILGNHDKTIRNQVDTEYKFDYFETRYKGHKIVMSHYAMREWNQKGRGSLHFFGHSHGSLAGVGRSMDVGYDVEGRIFTLDEVVNRMLKISDYGVNDHH